MLYMLITHYTLYTIYIICILYMHSRLRLGLVQKRVLASVASLIYKCHILSHLLFQHEHCIKCIESTRASVVSHKAEVRRSFITTTVREQHPRSHHKCATGRVRTGDLSRCYEYYLVYIYL